MSTTKLTAWPAVLWSSTAKSAAIAQLASGALKDSTFPQGSVRLANHSWLGVSIATLRRSAQIV